jgi:Bacteriophage HK97-gp10, putative tail-component
VARSKISFSYDAIGSEILRAPWMAEHMKQRAERIAEEARSRAPVYEGPGHDPSRGSYRDAFRVESTSHGGRKGDRAAGTVINDDEAAVFIEYGTREHTSTVRGRDGGERTVTVPAMPARHVLGAAMMAAAGDE